MKEEVIAVVAAIVAVFAVVVLEAKVRAAGAVATGMALGPVLQNGIASIKALIAVMRISVMIQCGVHFCEICYNNKLAVLTKVLAKCVDKHEHY